MNALFLRCDASAEIGTGHFFRMLALGQAARDRGVRPELVCSAGSEKLLVQADHADIPVARLEQEPGSQADARALSSRVEGAEAEAGVVVDGYHFAPAYFERLAEASDVVAAVDDVGRHPFPVDVLVNVNPHAREIDYDVPDDCVCLFGPKFAFLRRQFRDVRRGMEEKRGYRDAPPVASRVLISLGGGDPTNETGKALRALEIADFTGTVDVIVGPANRHLNALKQVAASLDANVRIRRNVTNMASVMDGQHLAVCAAGGTSWELACMGVPMLQIVLADNQRPIAEALSSRRIAVLAGSREEVSPQGLADQIASLLTDRDRRATIAARGRRLVDGGGAFRVVEAIRERATRDTLPESVRSRRSHG